MGRGEEEGGAVRAPELLALFSGAVKSHKRQKVFSVITYIKADVRYLVALRLPCTASSEKAGPAPCGLSQGGICQRKDLRAEEAPAIPGG